MRLGRRPLLGLRHWAAPGGRTGAVHTGELELWPACAAKLWGHAADQSRWSCCCCCCCTHAAPALTLPSALCCVPFHVQCKVASCADCTFELDFQKGKSGDERCNACVEGYTLSEGATVCAKDVPPPPAGT